VGTPIDDCSGINDFKVWGTFWPGPEQHQGLSRQIGQATDLYQILRPGGSLLIENNGIGLPNAAEQFGLFDVLSLQQATLVVL
jgi:hypothetical protein